MLQPSAAFPSAIQSDCANVEKQSDLHQKWPIPLIFQQHFGDVTCIALKTASSLVARQELYYIASNDILV
ncbi:Hypothetical protein NGAL_HAMBI2605_65290 [Neorhizobium galegae bv. orientalis]|nr:Hypothetical protein NGAL_HAMBI2605_65290 [Neorhizobium galegae bv. orientalis]